MFGHMSVFAPKSWLQSKLVRAWLKEYGLPQFAQSQARLAHAPTQLPRTADMDQQPPVVQGSPPNHGSDEAADTIRGSVGAAASSQEALDRQGVKKQCDCLLLQTEGVRPAPGESHMAGSRPASGESHMAGSRWFQKH
eukprot:646674-Pelagomonas_calceolata.AAC.3